MKGGAVLLIALGLGAGLAPGRTLAEAPASAVQPAPASAPVPAAESDVDAAESLGHVRLRETCPGLSAAPRHRATLDHGDRLHRLPVLEPTAGRPGGSPQAMTISGEADLAPNSWYLDAEHEITTNFAGHVAAGTFSTCSARANRVSVPEAMLWSLRDLHVLWSSCISRSRRSTT